jgi:uncharacterized LabA/DUF88 family protein
MPPYNLCIIGLLLLGAFFLLNTFIMKRVIFYFDGFNFYNGLKEKANRDLQWKNYYWIDIFKFCKQFVFEHEGSELVAVKYFTAPPQNTIKRSRQSAFLNANKLINGDKFVVFNGHYINKDVICQASCKQNFKMPEEKCTDVNLALNMLIDCIEDNVDTIVLITADSDQIPTIKLLKSKYPTKKLKVYFPPCRQSIDIRNQVGQVVFLENHEDKFKAAKMSTEITNGKLKYTRPLDWKQ